MGRLTWSAEFRETWTAYDSQPLQQTNNDTMRGDDKVILCVLVGKTEIFFFLFSFFTLAPNFQYQNEKQGPPNKNYFSKFPMKKALFGLCKFCFLLFGTENEEEELKGPSWNWCSKHF